MQLQTFCSLLSNANVVYIHHFRTVYVLSKQFTVILDVQEKWLHRVHPRVSAGHKKQN